MATKKYKVLEDNLVIYSSILNPDYGYKMIATLDKGSIIDVIEIVKGKDRDIAKTPGETFVFSRFGSREYIEPVKSTKKGTKKE